VGGGLSRRLPDLEVRHSLTERAISRGSVIRSRAGVLERFSEAFRRRSQRIMGRIVGK
jgi:hypothetical protein